MVVAMAGACAMTLAGACAGDDDSDDDSDGDRLASVCDSVEVLVEPIQGHVLPGVAVSYRYHPPTSGQHVPELPEAGVHTVPIDETRQVFALENGFVMLQYGPAVSDDDQRALEALAELDDRVIVAPAVSIDDDRVIALTAWQRRQLCGGVSTDDVRSFVASHVGQGPESA